MSYRQQQMQAAHDPEFADLPPGCIPAASNGGYRRDHHQIASRVYAGAMAQQPRTNVHFAQQQQQQQQQSGSSAGGTQKNQQQQQQRQTRGQDHEEQQRNQQQQL